MPYVPYSPIPNKKTNDEQDLESESLRSLKSETYNKLETNHNYLAFFGTLICAIYFLYCALNATSNSEDWHFIDNVNLIFHEAGHPIFSFFGDFMHIAGGTLGQLLIPAICGFSFLRSKQYYSATVMLMWLGQNLTSISIYASDAIKMELPLLGGDTSGHDWHNMLEMTGLLSYTDAISKSIHGIGVIIVLSAIGAMLYIFLLKKQNSI